MKKIIFILMALAMIFVVFSCDEPKGTENTEPQQPGTTSDNNTNTDTDNTTTDNNTDTDNEDYITQNPYEDLEKTLTVKVNSIDVLDFADGEWEYYDEHTLLWQDTDRYNEIYRQIGIMKFKNDGAIEDYVKSESGTYLFNSIEFYEEHKEFVYERMMPPDENEAIIFDDENLTICFFYTVEEKYNRTYDDFINRIEKFFNEDTSKETEYSFKTYKYSVTTNRENSAYLFLIETESVSKTNPEDIDYDIEKYIFKKIK